jgi:hypothetical protein
MNAFQIFGLQLFLSLVVYGLIAAWYVAPRLAHQPLGGALSPLLFLHAFRHVGMVFLVPAVVGPALPAAFAVPAAYGDLLAAGLAMLALVALRGGWSAAVPLVWLFNVVGALDLLYALVQGVRFQVELGAAYYLPTFLVPALLVTHALIFRLLLVHPR